MKHRVVQVNTARELADGEEALAAIGDVGEK